MLVEQTSETNKDAPKEPTSVSSIGWLRGRAIKILAYCRHILIEAIEKINNFLMRIFYGREPPQTCEEFLQSIEESSRIAEKISEEYKNKIRTFDTFINKDLKIKKAFEATLQQYGRFIATITLQTYTPNPSDTVIERWNKVKHEEVGLKHVWSERIRFVNSNSGLRSTIAEAVESIIKKRKLSAFEQNVLSLIPDFLHDSPRPSGINVKVDIVG